jgi:hypothetical protein
MRTSVSGDVVWTNERRRDGKKAIGEVFGIGRWLFYADTR